MRFEATILEKADSMWCVLTKIGAMEVPVNCRYESRLLAHLVKTSLPA